jgi:hypothetical protein
MTPEEKKVKHDVVMVGLSDFEREYVNIISLNTYNIQCSICGIEFMQLPDRASFGVARYEEVVVPDGYEGEWGSAVVCPNCYWVERGIHARFPTLHITFDMIARITKR